MVLCKYVTNKRNIFTYLHNYITIDSLIITYLSIYIKIKRHECVFFKLL